MALAKKMRMKKKFFKVGVYVGVAGFILAGSYYAIRFYKPKSNESKGKTQRKVVPSNERSSTEAKSVAVESVPTVEVPAQEVRPKIASITKRRRTKITDELKQKMISLADSHTNREVSVLCGIPEITVNRYLANARRKGLCKPAKKGGKRKCDKILIANTNSSSNNFKFQTV